MCYKHIRVHFALCWCPSYQNFAKSSFISLCSLACDTCHPCLSTQEHMSSKILGYTTTNGVCAAGKSTSLLTSRLITTSITQYGFHFRNALKFQLLEHTSLLLEIPSLSQKYMFVTHTRQEINLGVNHARQISTTHTSIAP